MPLSEKKCTPCEGGVAPLTDTKIHDYLQQLQDWSLGTDKKHITKTFHFKNYYHTMAFVNATAWISHQENHHPDLAVFYNRCEVTYTTHAAKGLTENDFICATKIDALS